MGKKILALFGKSCSGKDSVANWIVNNNCNTNKIVPYTTRPKRGSEVEGVDYHFVDTKCFEKLIYSGLILDYTKFGQWFYGNPSSEIKENKINVGVFNIYSLNYLLQYEKELDIMPVYIKCCDKVRLTRAILRETNPDCYEICRRFLSDKEDFKEIDFNHEVYDNSIKKEEFEGYDDILNITNINNFIKDINN